MMYLLLEIAAANDYDLNIEWGRGSKKRKIYKQFGRLKIMDIIIKTI